MNRIPEALTERDQWVVTYQGERYYPCEDQNSSETQASFSRVKSFAEKHGGKLTYVLYEEDPFAIIDLKKVTPKGRLTGEVIEIVKELHTYTEVNEYGTGLRLVCKGARLPDRRNVSMLHNQGEIKVFDANQDVILTGEQYGRYGSLTFHEKTRNVLEELQREYLPERDESDEPVHPINLAEIFSKYE